MNCPTCNTTLSGSEKICPSCGSVIQAGQSELQNVDEYWNTIHQSDAVHRDQLERTRRREQAAKQKKESVLLKKRMRIISPFLAVFVLCISLFIYRSYKNALLLQRVSNEVIGKSYSETDTGAHKRNGLKVVDPGKDYNKTILTFLDSDHLECVRTKTTLSLESGWNDHDVYAKVVYSYSLRVSFWGKVWLQFNNHEYDANFSEDGSISKFWIYY